MLEEINEVYQAVKDGLFWKTYKAGGQTAPAGSGRVQPSVAESLPEYCQYSGELFPLKGRKNKGR